MPRGSRSGVTQPVVTGDCEQRWERTSGSVAATKWFNIAGGTVGVDGTPTTASIMSEFHFDGGTDKVDTAYEGAAKTAAVDWTCVMWVIRDSSDDGQVTLAQNRSTGPNGGMIVARDNNLGSYGPATFQIYNPGFASVIDTVPAYTDNAWHQVVVTWDADGGAGLLPARPTVYLDGVATATAATTLYGAGTNWIVGGGTYNRWTGFIDTFRVYPRILSADEIKRDYQAGIAGHQARVVEENLISQYVPTGMTTTAWTDVTGSNNMTGAVTAPPAFDGDDYYTIGNPANLQFTNNWSIEAWGSQNADSSQNFERLVSRDDGSNRCFILSQSDISGNPFAGIFVGGSLKSATGSGDYADNNWHHYMVTHDGTTLRLYVDGALEASVATGGAMDNDAANWEVGRSAQSGGDDYLEGRCDTVRFYNVTLSLAQIKQNYYNGLAAHS
jgi:hypothetical protein